MRILSTALLALFVWSGPLPVAASEPIDIGGVHASIGAEKGKLLESLGKKYDVKEFRSETYLVTRGDASENTVGVVQFRDDKLVWASRDVGAFEGQEVRKFAQTLFHVLAALHEEDRAPIFITTAVSQNQSFAVGSITLEFPGRRVVVDIAYDDNLVDASIEEILFVDEARESGAPRSPGELPTGSEEPAGREEPASGHQSAPSDPVEGLEGAREAREWLPGRPSA